MQRRTVLSDRLLGTTNRSHFQGSRSNEMCA